MHLSLHKPQWHSLRISLLPILAGMLTAQIIATVFVYGSNMHLHRVVTAATNAGYFVIPTGPVTATLTSLKSALGGGLFYTLSIGVGLTLISWAGVCLWMGVLRRSKWALYASLLVWIALLVWVNGRGATLYPTLFCLLVPLSTAFIRLKATAGPNRDKHLWMVPVATLVLLTTIWATQFNNNLFISIRDHILLSNPIGRAVNDFYYRYTLYAAESFKSLNQKSVRSYSIEPISDTQRAQRLKKRLARYDMLYLPEVDHPDFMVSFEGDPLRLATPEGKTVEVSQQDLLAKPNHWLQKLSSVSDHHAPLRRITLIGLLMGFPILLYLMVYGVLRLFTGIALQQRAATFVTSGLSLLIGLLLFFPMLGIHPISISKENISQLLISDQWPQRVAALRHIEKNKIDIGRYPQYKPLLESPLVVERYYLARSLAVSRLPATYNDLNAMLGDRHPNVTCQIYYALGQRGNRAAIGPIQSQMTASDHWYAQWYGYRAIRRLGWFPSPSRQPH